MRISVQEKQKKQNAWYDRDELVLLIVFFLNNKLNTLNDETAAIKYLSTPCNQ